MNTTASHLSDSIKTQEYHQHPYLMSLRICQRISEMTQRTLESYINIVSPPKNQDPFIETKKKCVPENIDHLPMETRSLVQIENCYYICVPFTIEKRDGPSFSDTTMNNLIVDDNGNLMQLLFGGSPDSSLPPGQQLMQATEYRVGRIVAGRKFTRYI